MGQTAEDSLNNIPTEFDDLFRRHKADIGRCTTAKHPVEMEPRATSHREGVRRRTPDKAEPANQEVRNVRALSLIQLPLSPWASATLIVKKKNGELRSHALMKTFHIWVRPRFTPVFIWLGLSGRYQCSKQVGRKWPLLASWVYLNGDVCHLRCVTLPLISSEPYVHSHIPPSKNTINFGLMSNVRI